MGDIFKCTWFVLRVDVTNAPRNSNKQIHFLSKALTSLKSLQPQSSSLEAVIESNGGIKSRGRFYLLLWARARPSGLQSFPFMNLIQGSLPICNHHLGSDFFDTFSISIYCWRAVKINCQSPVIVNYLFPTSHQPFFSVTSSNCSTVFGIFCFTGPLVFSFCCI